MRSFFNRLTVPQQADILFHEGVYLLTREEPDFVVDMYQLNELYIEIYFHKKQEDFVVVKSFYSSEKHISELKEEVDILFPLHFSWRNNRYAC